MENDNKVLNGVFYIVTAIGLWLFGTIILSFIFGLIALFIGPENVDGFLVGFFIIVQILLFIVSFAYFIVGIVTGGEGLIFKRDSSDQDYLDQKEKENNTRRLTTCKVCKGTGECLKCNKKGHCKVCKGKGQIKSRYGEIITCEKCEGTGQCSYCEGERICLSCGGKGKVLLKEDVRKKIDFFLWSEKED